VPGCVLMGSGAAPFGIAGGRIGRRWFPQLRLAVGLIDQYWAAAGAAGHWICVAAPRPGGVPAQAGTPLVAGRVYHLGMRWAAWTGGDHGGIMPRTRASAVSAQIGRRP
jgi:hypothetical protein